jgi:hypothetical protein
MELVVCGSGTHRSLAPYISQIARPIELLDFLGQRYSTSRSELGFSKYPQENTRQVPALISEVRPRTWHNLHISFLFEFSFSAATIKD